MRVALLALAVLAAPAWGQPDLPANGSQLFRGLLHRFGYQAVEDNGQLPQTVVVFGRPGDVSRYGDLARRVQAAGGAVLIATETSYIPSYLPSGSIPPPPFPRAPRVPLDGRLADGSPTGRMVVSVPLEVGSDVAVTDIPTVALPVSDRLTPFAVRPGGVTAGVYGTRPGRVVVLAGESALTNRLIAGRFDDDTDTGNLEFAVNLARWLKPPGPGPHTCLFVEHGTIMPSLDVVDYEKALLHSLPTPAPPPLSAFLEPEAQAKLADAANEAIDRVQSDDRPNRALTRGDRYGKTVRWLLGVLALIAAVAMVRRARASRTAGGTGPAQAELPKPIGSFAQRREELLRTGDHTAAVREYLVELFRQHGLPLDEFRHPTRMPRVQADAPTRRRLATLWEAAYGPHPISYTRWKELEPMIDAVRADAAAGRWRFGGGRA